MESLRTNKYQYGVDLMTVASPISRKLGPVIVDYMLEHREEKHFLKTNVLLAIVVDRLCRSCIRKLAPLESRALSRPCGLFV